MRRIIVFYFALVLFAVPMSTFAQSEVKTVESPAHYYRLTYSVQEVGEAGKVVNSRTYATSIATGGGPTAQIRIGDKVPVLTEGNKGDAQYQYIDVGVNIDSLRALEVDNKLALSVTAEISSTTKTFEPTTTASTALPVIRSNKWSASVLVPIAKPTIIFSSDNIQDKGKVQVELTATRID